jgi:hypothetical protein
MLGYRDFKSHKLFLNLFFFLIVCLPSFVMIQFNQSSLALGTAIGQSIILFFLLFSKNLTKLNLNLINIFTVCISFIFLHSIITFLITHAFNLERFIGSIFIFSIIFFTSIILNKYFNNKNYIFNQIFITIFYVLFSFGIISIVFNITILPSYKNLNKGVFPFFEPSHFILSLAPFLFYYYSSDVNRISKICVFFISIILLLYLSNLTMLLIFTTSTLLLFKKKRHTFIFILFIPFLFFIIQNLEYYSSRLNTSSDDNLSTLVWLQGWENAFINFTETYGFGVGFQQFGINGLKGNATEAIAYLRASEGNTTLNQLDGGTLGAKIFGEFGFFGLILIYFLTSLSLKSFFKLRRMTNTNNLHLKTFSLCVFSVFIFELFVRSMSYISNNVVLLIVALIYITNHKNVYDK